MPIEITEYDEVPDWMLNQLAAQEKAQAVKATDEDDAEGPKG